MSARLVLFLFVAFDAAAWVGIAIFLVNLVMGSHQ